MRQPCASTPDRRPPPTPPPPACREASLYREEVFRDFQDNFFRQHGKTAEAYYKELQFKYARRGRPIKAPSQEAFS